MKITGAQSNCLYDNDTNICGTYKKTSIDGATVKITRLVRLNLMEDFTMGEIKDITFRLTYIMAGSSTLNFLKFWNQNVVNILFLVVKSLEVISGFISKFMKKILNGATIEIFDI